MGNGWQKSNVFLADINGDGEAEAAMIRPDNQVWAYPNVYATTDKWDNGMWATEKHIGDGWASTNLYFADLNGDGKAEMMRFAPNGDLEAVVNIDGMAYNWAPIRPVDFGLDRANTFFADLDGDRKAEIIYINSKGELEVRQNIDGVDNVWGTPHRAYRLTSSHVGLDKVPTRVDKAWVLHAVGPKPGDLAGKRCPTQLGVALRLQVAIAKIAGGEDRSAASGRRSSR